jgi:hypothetical protein
MNVNKFKIPLSLFKGVSATTINFAIQMEYQIVDNSELIEKEFVEVEVEKAVNAILDYDRTRFSPVNSNGGVLNKVIYKINMLNEGVYVDKFGLIGFDNEDIKFRKSSFKETFLSLLFYDSDNPMTQNIVTNTSLYANLNTGDFLSASDTNSALGQPKDVSLIPINFILDNPLTSPRGFAEGFYLYDYKDSLKIGEQKYLYMRASFKNSKTGKSTNLMVKNTPQFIDKLLHELYTRFILTRTSKGYFYEVDSTYQGNLIAGALSNVESSTSNTIINLYEINAL